MSDPGTSIQDYLTQAQRMKMAQALMGNNANPTTPYAGLANAGGDLLGAQAMQRIQQQSDPQNQVMQQRYGMTPGQAQNLLNPSMASKAGDWLSNLFGMGGS